MKLKTRIIAALAAASLAVNTTLLISLPVKAATSDYTQWTGHEKKDEPFDTWDGTFDTSWLDEHVGDETDPYIIDSAEDWAALAFITSGFAIDFNNIDEIAHALDINTQANLADEVLISNSTTEFKLRDAMTQTQIDAVVPPHTNGGTVLNLNAKNIGTSKFSASNLFFRDIDGTLYYVDSNYDTDKLLSLDFTIFVTLDTTSVGNPTLISYKIVNNTTGDTYETTSPFETPTTYTEQRLGRWVDISCYNYDWIFQNRVYQNALFCKLSNVSITKSTTNLVKYGDAYVYSETQLLKAPIVFKPGMLPGYNMTTGSEVTALPATCTFVGKGTQDSLNLFEGLLSSRDLAAAYPSEYAKLYNIAKSIDTAFTNKVIKLGSNVDFSNGISAFKDGLAGTLDFNERVLIGPECPAITKILHNGIITNGVLVSSSSSYPLIKTAEGLIKDCDFLRTNCFFNTSVASTAVPNMMGTVDTLERIKFYNCITEGCLLSDSANTIKDSSMLVINGSLTGGVYVGCGFANSVNTVTGCQILADSEIIGSSVDPYLLNYYAFGRITSKIEDCHTNSFSVYCNSGSSTIAQNIQNIKNVSCYTNFLGDIPNRGIWCFAPVSSIIENATIDCKIEGTMKEPGSGDGMGHGNTMKNCTILLDVQRFAYGYLLGQGENCYIDIAFRDTSDSLTTITSGTFKDSFIRIAPTEGCNASISAGSGADLYSLEHCYVELINVNLPGTMSLCVGSQINNTYFKLKTTHTGFYGLALAGSNSYFDIEFEGGKTPFIGREFGSSIGRLENSFIHINYKGNFTPKEYSSATSNNLMKNCVYILTIDETSTGCISTGLNNFQTIENSFIYVDEFPDSCYMTMLPLIPEYSHVGHYTNSTFIMPRLNWGSNKSFGMSPCSSAYTGGDFHDIYAYMNVYPYQSNNNIPNNAIMISGGLDKLIYNVSMEVNLYDLAGNPADVPVRFCQNIQTQTPGLNGVCFKTNVKDAAIFDADEPGYREYLLGNNAGFTFKNIYLDVPNGSLRADIKSGLMAAFPTDDFAGYWSNRSYKDSNYYQYAGLATLGYHILNRLGYDVSNILIPEGQSVYYQRYLDDPARIDSENIPAFIDQFYNHSKLAPAPSVAGDWDYSVDPDWVTRVNGEHISSAEIAYLLDVGGTNSRTTNWTVLEDITICAPDTGEVLFTIPKHVDLTTTPYFEQTTPFSDITLIPTSNTFSPISTLALASVNTASFYSTSLIKSVSSLSGALEQSPVYKYTISSDGHGELTGESFSRSLRTTGDFFAKAGAVILGEASPLAGYVLSSVTENGSYIPSTDSSSYKVQGYQAPPTDAIFFASFVGRSTPSTPPARHDPNTPTYDDTAIITSFKVGDYQARIEQNGYYENGSITLSIPEDLDISNIVPGIIWSGEALTPGEGVTQDLTSSITYTVLAESGREKPYDLTIEYIPIATEPENPPVENLDDTAIITAFTVSGHAAAITQNKPHEEGVITLVIPEGEDVSLVVPDITWKGIAITPSATAAQDFTAAMRYTVHAESGRTKTYRVQVKIAYYGNPYTGDTAVADIAKTILLVLVIGGSVVFIHHRKRYC